MREDAKTGTTQWPAWGPVEPEAVCGCDCGWHGEGTRFVPGAPLCRACEPSAAEPHVWKERAIDERVKRVAAEKEVERLRRALATRSVGRAGAVLKDKPAHMSRALEWIERNEPGGIALVARAFAETYAPPPPTPGGTEACGKCDGTGVRLDDAAKGGYVKCWPCNGTGRAPAGSGDGR